MNVDSQNAKVRNSQHKNYKGLKHVKEHDICQEYSRSRYRRQRRTPPSSQSSTSQSRSYSTKAETSTDSGSNDRPSESIPIWPPHGSYQHAELTHGRAYVIIGNGASRFSGHTLQACHAPYRHPCYYAFANADNCNEDCYSKSVTPPSPISASMSLCLGGPTQELLPYNTLEQPSMHLCWGAEAGTITLNRWISSFGPGLPRALSSPLVTPKPIELSSVLARLCYAQHGLDPDPMARHTYLYTYLVYDPDGQDHYSDLLDRQIAVLVNVLDTEHWFDFSMEENQIVAGFYETNDSSTAITFFQQLLLSVELFQRVHSREITEYERKDFLSKISLRVAWDLALAQRWLENVFVETVENGDLHEAFHFVLPNKLQQIALLEEFALALKWPMAGIGSLLDETGSDEKHLKDRGAESVSWLSGVILPGSTASWLIMKCLIDCDRDATKKLDGLGHMTPNSGFQYRSSTYWYWECIVGKVMGAAKGVKNIAGWVGPCLYSPDLDRVHGILIRQQAVGYDLRTSKIKSMARRSDPLGPLSDSYRIDDYELVVPDIVNVVDSIRIEKLSFLQWDRDIAPDVSNEPLTYNAAVVFAVDGESWPVRLRYDVSFIACHPCHNGPHVLYRGYSYRSVRADQLLYQRCWGGAAADGGAWYSSSEGGSFGSSQERVSLRTPQSVLVVEAFGVSENEILSRAWCSHLGLSAIVTNIRKACMACSIRQAYAACVSIVILTDGSKDDEIE